MDRLRKLQTLIDKFGGPSALAKRLKHKNASFLVQMAGPNPTRPITEKTARKIEFALDLPIGWLDSTDEAPILKSSGFSAVGSADLQAILDACAKHQVSVDAVTLVRLSVLVERFAAPERRAELIEAVVTLLAGRLV